MPDACSRALSLLILVALPLGAQLEIDFNPSFDSAEVKAVHPTLPFSVVLGSFSHGTLTFTNATLAQCLKFALNLSGDNQIAGPDWIRSTAALYDMVGRTSPNFPEGRVRLMALRLLTERFELKLHHEQREVPFYALVVDKKGLKLAPAPTGGSSLEIVRQGSIISRRTNVAHLVFLLQYYTGIPIVDTTHLTGMYDVRLEWTATVRPEPQGTASPTLISALSEQLGLALDLRKGPMDVVIIDHAEKTPLPY